MKKRCVLAGNKDISACKGCSGFDTTCENYALMEECKYCLLQGSYYC